MSKKTLKSAKVKIKSERNKAFIGFSLLFIVILGFVWFSSGSKETKETIELSGTCVLIGQECFELEIADTDEERMKGLSDRDMLAEDTGMLFSFEQAEEQCFWMKDMRFNIDIIWADAQKNITKTVYDISPDTYPEMFCEKDARYVLEFNSGFAEKHGLKTGTTLQFE